MYVCVCVCVCCVRECVRVCVCVLCVGSLKYGLLDYTNGPAARLVLCQRKTKRLARDVYFDTVVTHSGRLHYVTDTDCWVHLNCIQ